jgi:uncharacterized membrane protein YeaQ/YmgE (transglycosylase-associated protein family)
MEPAVPAGLALSGATPHFRTRIKARPAMSLLGWILFGLITGFVASRVVNRRGEGCILNVALGIVGALVGGFIFTGIGGMGVTGFNLYSMFVAIIGAIVVLLLYHALTGRNGLR